MNQHRFYKTAAWQNARDEYIKYRESIDGGMCEVCGEEPGYIVHHKIWLNDDNCNDPSIALNPENFRYECLICHNKEIDPNKVFNRRYSFGVNGEILSNE